MKMTFKQFQQTRRKVTAPYMGDEGENPEGETAFTYLNSFNKYIGESYAISCDPRWTTSEGKFYLILGNAEYNSNNLEELESLLFEWIQEN